MAPLRPPRAASARSHAVPPRAPGSPGPLAAGAPYPRRRLAATRPDRRAAVRAPLRCRRPSPCAPPPPPRAPSPRPARAPLPLRRPHVCALAPRPGRAAASLPGRAPATARRAEQAKHGRRGWNWELGSHLHVGPSCQAPPLMFSFLLFD